MRLPRAALTALLPLALLASACGSNPPTPGPSSPGASASPSAQASATPSSGATAGGGSSPANGGAATAVSPVPAPVTQAGLAAVYAQLHPPSAGGADCTSGTSTPSWSTCPLTARLVAALNAAMQNQSGPGADPLCGCQSYDPNSVVTYSVGTPPGGGTVHVSSFGAPLVAYVVIDSHGQLLIDDIVYCNSSPHSIYPQEHVSGC